MSDKDIIYRQAAVDALWKALFKCEDDMEKQFQESDELDINEWILHRIFIQNMSDIDRQTILNLPSAQPEQCSDCIANGGDWECDHIHCHKGQLPSAQPEILACGEGELNVPDTNVMERKTGKWIKLYDDTFHCQLCGHTFMVIQGEDSMNYCPNCGAKME